MGRRLTQDQVIERIVQIHGDTYELSRVNYKNKRTKIELVCKIHGVFKSSTDQLFRGQGCSDCGHVKTGLKKRLSEKDVLNHPDIFIYKLFYSSLLIEKGDYNKSLIIMSELINISSNGDPILYSELGFIYSLKKDYNNSIENYEKNIDLIDTSKYNYSFYSCPYDGLGMLYYELGNDNLTIQNLEKTIYLKPNSKSNRYEILIKLYLKHNNSEDAIRIARKWKEVNPIDYNLSKITHLIN